jgi:hypothetical protein
MERRKARSFALALDTLLLATLIAILVVGFH